MLFDIDRCAGPTSCSSSSACRARACPRCDRAAGASGSPIPTRAAGLRVPVSGIAGDQQAALFGQACFSPGMTKNTYGTGSFVLVNLGDAHPPPVDGLLTTVAWQLGEATTYAMEGSIFVTGAAVQWLRDGLGIIETSSEAGPLAASVPDTDGVVFVPAFTGLGSPYFDPYARGAVLGLTRGTDACAPRACGRRGDGVADRRRDRRHHRGSRHPAHRAARRRWRQRDGRAVPVPGRRARRHRAAAGRPPRPRCSAPPPSPGSPKGCGRHRPKRRRRGGRTPRSSPPRSPAPTNGGPIGVVASTGPAIGSIPTPDGRAIDRMRRRTRTFGDGGAGGQRASGTVARGRPPPAGRSGGRISRAW